jgi:hypothetical protein
MPLGGPGYVRCLSALRAAGPNRATFTTAISALNEQARCALGPADWYEGRTLRVTFAGSISNIVTGPTSFTFEFRLGPTSTIAAFSTGALLCSTTAHTTVPLWGEILLTAQVLGAGTTAKLMGQGIITSRALVDAAGADVTTIGHPTLMAPETTPAQGTGFDSTIVNVADFFVACSNSQATNAFQLQQYILEDLGV